MLSLEVGVKGEEGAEGTKEEVDQIEKEEEHEEVVAGRRKDSRSEEKRESC